MQSASFLLWMGRKKSRSSVQLWLQADGKPTLKYVQEQQLARCKRRRRTVRRQSPFGEMPSQADGTGFAILHEYGHVTYGLWAGNRHVGALKVTSAQLYS